MKYFIAAIFFALVWMIVPLPPSLWWWHPNVVLLVLIYWVVAHPADVSFGWAFMVGVLQDVLLDTVLGEHAFAALIVVTLLRAISHIFRSVSHWQQSLLLFPILLLYQLVIVCAQGMFGQLNSSSWFWLPAFTSALLWPILSGCFRTIDQQHRRYR